MERQHIHDLENLCIEEQPPACTAGCPLHLDARGMIENLQKENFGAAFGIVARFLPFPTIISRICDHPCELVCKRTEAGEAIRINDLERAAVDYGYKASALPHLQRAQKKKRIAIIGAGLSGLTAAADLGLKGHEVVVYEAEPQTLNRVRGWQRPPLAPQLIETDLKLLEKAGVTIKTSTPVGSGGVSFASLLDEYDAIYVGIGSRSAADLETGLDVNDEGRIVSDPLTFATSNPKVFSGGCHRYGPAAYSPITSLHDGRYAVLSIERVFQGASLSANREGQGPYPTRLYTNTSRFAPLPAVEPADVLAGYTREEAIAEAQRCFPCHCLECVHVCDYLAHFGSYPKRYIREIYNNDCIVMGIHKANRLTNSCSMCGLCEVVCPDQLNMGSFCLEARQSSVEKGKMQPSFHDFALRDFAFSNSEAFALTRHQPGHDSSAAVFFPGCQLSGSSPDHVLSTYEYLCSHLENGVGLMLRCCGSPAHWSGREELFRSGLEDVKKEWEGLGRPTFIVACPTCLRMFKDYLPDLPVTSLWTVLDDIGLPPSAGQAPTEALGIHDPCTSRAEEGEQKSARNLLTRLGVKTVELNAPGQTTCCGFGGLMSFVNPEVADKVVDRRIKDSEADYVTYCSMCRDNFSRRGKKALHILDLLFPASVASTNGADPGFSQRQESRARLKNKLLSEVWKEPMAEISNTPELVISPDVHILAEKRLIMEADIRAVIRHAESTGNKIKDLKSGHFVAYHRPAAVTYWVEYTPEGDDRFIVHKIYSHRMQVGTEPS